MAFSFLADGLLLFSGSLRNSAQARSFSFLPRYHSVPERASWCTEWTRCTVEGLLVYATRFQRLSVQKTGAFGTEEIFGTKNPLLWYAMRFQEILCADNYLLLIQEPEHPERDLIVEDVFSIVLDHIAIFDVFNLFLPFLSPANLKGLSVNLKI